MNGPANSSLSGSLSPSSNSTQPSANNAYADVYFVIGLLGVLLNLSVAVTVWRRTVIPWTPPRWYLIHQCFCDVLCCLFLSLNWIVGLDNAVPATPFGDFVCLFWHTGFLFWTSFTASLVNLQLFTIERYMSVLNQTRHRDMFSKKKLRLLIAFIWVFAVLFEAVRLLQSTRVGGSCVRNPVPSDRQTITQVWTVFVLLVYVAIPLPLLLYYDIKVIIALRSCIPSARRNSEHSLTSQRDVIAKDLTYAVIIIGCLFALCSFPDTLYFTLYTFTVVDANFTHWLYHLIDGVFNVHFLLMPIVYIVNIPVIRSQMAQTVRHHTNPPPANADAVLPSATKQGQTRF